MPIHIHLQLWPFSSRARAARADRKASKHRAERARADAEWEVLCMTGGTAVPGTEPYDGALRRERRQRARASEGTSRSGAAQSASTPTPRNLGVAPTKRAKRRAERESLLRSVKTC